MFYLVPTHNYNSAVLIQNNGNFFLFKEEWTNTLQLSYENLAIVLLMSG